MKRERPSVRAGELRNGSKHGVWVESDGFVTTIYERTYRDGLLHGVEYTWNGRSLASECDYVDGAKHGTRRTYYENGTLESECPYVAGKAEGTMRMYRSDGSLAAECELRGGAFVTGTYELWSSDGRHLSFQGAYEQGKRVGPWIGSDERGRFSGSFIDDKRHGPFQITDKLGTWAGHYDHGRPTGRWRLVRDERESDVIAEGDYPDGAPAVWRVTGSSYTHAKQTVTIEVSTREQLERWLALVEAWLRDRWCDTTKWPRDDQARARAWLANVAVSNPDPDPTVMTDEEVVRRDSLVAAGQPVVATCELPDRIVLASPDGATAPEPRRAVPGLYEVIVERREATLVRRAGVPIVRWDYCDESCDDHFIVWDGRGELYELEYPEDQPLPEIAVGPGLVWVRHFGGDPMRVFVGLAESGEIAAVYLQMYWAHTRRR